MTPAEYAGWQIHLARYPPAEHILAALWLTVSRALGNEKATAADMGYWLEAPETRRERQAAEEKAKRRALAQATRAAYLRRRTP